MGKGDCVFSDAWLEKEEYKCWLGPSPEGSKRRANCRLCRKDFDIANMGESALKSHAQGAKHKRLVAGKMAATQLTLNFGASASCGAKTSAVILCACDK